MSESAVFLFSGKYFLIGKKRIHTTKVTGNASIKITQGCLIWVPNSPFVRQQDPAALLMRCSRKWEPRLLQECCPVLSAGSLYDLRTCREAVRTLERKGSLLTPKPSSCPSISQSRVTLGLCAMAPRGSALNGLCRKERTRERPGLSFTQSRLTNCKSDQKNTFLFLYFTFHVCHCATF